MAELEYLDAKLAALRKPAGSRPPASPPSS